MLQTGALAPPRHIRGVMERTGAQGRSVIAVRSTEARDAVRELLASGARVIVICLLRWRKNGRQQRRRAAP